MSNGVDIQPTIQERVGKQGTKINGCPPEGKLSGSLLQFIQTAVMDALISVMC